VIDFGRELATDRHRVAADTYARMARHFTAEQIVTLTAFGALMVATNVVNNALEVDLDDYLKPYVKAAP
jgi:alkylhydroperoxidase family enzyme